MTFLIIQSNLYFSLWRLSIYEHNEYIYRAKENISAIFICNIKMSILMLIHIVFAWWIWCRFLFDRWIKLSALSLFWCWLSCCNISGNTIGRIQKMVLSLSLTLQRLLAAVIGAEISPRILLFRWGLWWFICRCIAKLTQLFGNIFLYMLWNCYTRCSAFNS